MLTIIICPVKHLLTDDLLLMQTLHTAQFEK